MKLQRDVDIFTVSCGAGYYLFTKKKKKKKKKNTVFIYKQIINSEQTMPRHFKAECDGGKQWLSGRNEIMIRREAQ